MVSKNSAAHHSKKDSSEFPHHFKVNVSLELHGTPWNSMEVPSFETFGQAMAGLRYHMVPRFASGMKRRMWTLWSPEIWIRCHRRGIAETALR